jgi:HSP20 family protein
MMKVYWDTLDLENTLQREVDRIFHGFARPLLGARETVTPSYPQVHLGQDNDNLYAEVEAPGVDPKSLEVSIEDNILQVTGKREEATDDKEGVRWIRRERHGGEFAQRVRLPIEVEVDKVAADYAQGILKITLPKTAATKPKQIEIKVS